MPLEAGQKLNWFVWTLPDKPQLTSWGRWRAPEWGQMGWRAGTSFWGSFEVVPVAAAAISVRRWYLDPYIMALWGFRPRGTAQASRKLLITDSWVTAPRCSGCCEYCCFTACLSIFVLFQVLCNGPGTCVPLCVAALLLGILGIKKVVIVYVESVCRVHTLSLTGKILYSLSDYFFVQWPSLRDKYPKSIFLGRIV